MAKLIVLFATTTGHTGRIATRIAEVCRMSGHHVDALNVAALPRTFSLSVYDGAVIGGSVYFGLHQKALRHFVRSRISEINRIPTAMFSVSMAAFRGDEQGRNTAWEYLRRFEQATRLVSNRHQVFAGGLFYTRYGFLTKRLMLWIARRMGADTDTTRDHVYTDWNRVDAFASDFSHMLPQERAAA